MKTIGKLLVVASLLVAVAAWAFVSSRPTIEERARSLLEQQVAAANDPEARAEVVRELRGFNPEWDLMHRTFLALSLVDRALLVPEEADRLLPVIDGLVNAQIADQRQFGDGYFLLDYAAARPFLDPSGASVFVDGEIALVLGARRFVRDEPQVAAEHRARVEALAAQFERSPALLPESYPDEAWLFCNTNALVAMRMADVLDGTDHSDLIARWVARARAERVDPRTGLLGSEFTWSGAPLDGAEGSSLWLVLTNLRLLDDAFAHEQYELARASLVDDLFGFGYAREWPESAVGAVDVDSGPIVPLIDASPSSSGFALLAARAFGDEGTYRTLARALGAADVVVALDPRLAELAANPMGDVILLHALTTGPLWERIGAGRPAWIDPGLAGSAAGVEEQLRAPFDADWVGVEPDGEQVVARSCAERLAHPAASEWAEYRTAAGADAFVRCAALGALRGVAPATTPLDLEWGPEVLDQLPPTVGWTVAEDAAAAALEAERAGHSWRSVDPSVRATVEAGSLQVRGDGFYGSLTLLGRGDVDRDGSEDLVLSARLAADGGSLRIVRVQVVGRTPGGLAVTRTFVTGG
ncbi:MAG: hypothetical protein ABMA64_05405 [Myxococcota bacterium]